jgi:hypothetical protein
MRRRAFPVRENGFTKRALLWGNSEGFSRFR